MANELTQHLQIYRSQLGTLLKSHIVRYFIIKILKKSIIETSASDYLQAYLDSFGLVLGFQNSPFRFQNVNVTIFSHRLVSIKFAVEITDD